MRRKKFYSLVQMEGFTGVKRQDGFQIKKDGIRVYLYRDRGEILHAIDPDTGLSFHSTFFSTALEDREDAIFDVLNIKKLKKIKRSETYPILVKIFKAHKQAAVLEKRYRAIIRDMEGEQQAGAAGEDEDGQE